MPPSRLKLHVLSSGSGGNASIVEDSDTGDCIAIDCGICKRDFLMRSAECGVDLSRLSAILITHDHSDHVCGLGVVMRGLAKQGAHPTIYADEAVQLASGAIRKLQGDFEIRSLEIGGDLAISTIGVHAFRTSHDAASSCGFRFECGDESIGFMTDTGIVTPQAHDSLDRCRILAIESNHDERMLWNGEYPYYLKQRIASDSGHLSNDACTVEISKLLWDGLEEIVAMHISKNNNTFPLATGTIQAMLDDLDHPARLCCGRESRAVSV